MPNLCRCAGVSFTSCWGGNALAFLSQRLVSRKLWPACPLSAAVFAIWKLWSHPAALIATVSRRGDGKRHLEHLN